MNADEHDVLTVPEVAALLRVSRQHVYNEVSRGRIPHRRVGSAIRFSRRLVIAWLEGGGK